MPEHNLRTRGRGEQVVVLPLQAEDAVDTVASSNSANAPPIKNGRSKSSRSTAKRGSSCTPSLAELALLMGSACFLIFVLLTTRSKHFVATQSLDSQTTTWFSPNELLRVKQAASSAQSASRHSPKTAESLHKGIPASLSLPATETKTLSFNLVSQANINAAAKRAKALNLSVAGIDPITCSSFLESVRSETYPVHFRDPNRETLPDGTFNHTSFTRMTLTENPFWISVHHRMADRVRWTMYREGTYYEKALEKLWKGILKESGPGARILDVGYVLLVTLVYGLNIECLCCVYYRPACAGIDVE
jgi:hypothetical protein